MRSRLVVWGSNASNEKVLLAISLNADENKVDIWSIPEKDITEDYYNKMLSLWREGRDLEIPASAEHRTTELTMSDSILPEDIKVERGDVIQRAQMEWHFVVLSSKLYKNFKNDLEDLTDKIKRLEVFDPSLWDELKNTWDNVQKHIIEKNIFRDHADSLKSKTNALFEELKTLRKSFNQELAQKSKETASFVFQKIEEVEKRVLSGAVLKPLFDELKSIQDEFKALSLNREDRENVSKKLNDTFKSIREKREAKGKPGNQGATSNERIEKRYTGLVQAIAKMEQLIARDKKDIEIENKRIATTNGQLEAQIRVAKIRMIEERIRSKEEKLNELKAIQVKLDKLNDKVKKRQEKMVEKNIEKEKIKVEEEKIKAKISSEMQQAQVEISSEESEKLKKAADEIRESKNTKPKKTKEDVSPLESTQLISAPSTETITTSTSEPLSESIEMEENSVEAIQDTENQLLNIAEEITSSETEIQISNDTGSDIPNVE